MRGRLMCAALVMSLAPIAASGQLVVSTTLGEDDVAEVLLTALADQINGDIALPARVPLVTESWEKRMRTTIGHMLIDVLSIPAVGREEDAADQLATLYFAEDPVSAT